MLSEPYLKRLERVEPYAELWRDDKKFVEHRIGLYATLYFEHTHPMVASNEAVRRALIECWHDYWKVVGIKNWRWVYDLMGPGSSVPSYRVPTEKVPPIDEILNVPAHFASYQYYGSGGVHDDDASEYLFDLAAFPVYSAPELPTKFAYLRLQAPREFIANGRLTDFVALIKRCASRLKPNQAYGGLGFLRTYNEESTTRRTEAQMSKIFSGVDIDVPSVQLSGLYSFYDQKPKGITGAHWLNFLSTDWIEKLGGLEHLRDQLPADSFTVEPYDGGIFIQAGPYPEPGHKNDGLPPRYVWLNRVLKPIRVADISYHRGNTPGELASQEDVLPYLTRFDVASDALGRQLEVDESNTPSAASVAQSPASPDRVEGGGLCSKSGWWITPAKVASRRYFKAGEVMPVIEGSQYGATFWQWDIDQSSAKG